MNDYELNRRELTGDDALRFAREAGMEQHGSRGLHMAGVGDLIRFARLVRAGWTPPRNAGVVVDAKPIDTRQLKQALEAATRCLQRNDWGTAFDRVQDALALLPDGVNAPDGAKNG